MDVSVFIIVCRLGFLSCIVIVRDHIFTLVKWQDSAFSSYHVLIFKATLALVSPNISAPSSVHSYLLERNYLRSFPPAISKRWILNSLIPWEHVIISWYTITVTMATARNRQAEFRDPILDDFFVRFSSNVKRNSIYLSAHIPRFH